MGLMFSSGRGFLGTLDWREVDIAYPTSRLKCLKTRGTTMSTTGAMIYIEPYYRIRFGSIEHVCGHWRRRRGAGHSNVVYLTSVA